MFRIRTSEKLGWGGLPPPKIIWPICKLHCGNFGYFFKIFFLSFFSTFLKICFMWGCTTPPCTPSNAYVPDLYLGLHHKIVRQFILTGMYDSGAIYMHPIDLSKICRFASFLSKLPTYHFLNIIHYFQNQHDWHDQVLHWTPTWLTGSYARIIFTYLHGMHMSRLYKTVAMFTRLLHTFVYYYM